MNAETFAREVRAARKRVAAMDKADGFKDREPKTILFAIVAGTKNPSSGATFDAIAMLEDLTLMKVVD